MVDFENDIDECLRVLKNGGLILYPTDTIWGIGCDATDQAAVGKIYKLKRREDNKALIVLVADERDVLQYVAAPDLAVFDYLDQIEKPTTVIYEGAIGLAENLVAEDGSPNVEPDLPRPPVGHEVADHAAHGAGVAKVPPHELLDGQNAIGSLVPIKGRQPHLLGAIEHVVGLPGMKVQLVAQPQQKLGGVAHLALVVLADGAQ